VKKMSGTKDILEETSEFLEKKFEEANMSDVRAKDYIGILPPQYELVRLKKAVENCLKYINFAGGVAWSRKYHRELKKMKKRKKTFLFARKINYGLYRSPFHDRFW